MNITIKLEADLEGIDPGSEVVKNAIAAQIPQAILSEDIDHTNEWAILIESIEVQLNP